MPTPLFLLWVYFYTVKHIVFHLSKGEKMLRAVYKRHDLLQKATALQPDVVLNAPFSALVSVTLCNLMSTHYSDYTWLCMDVQLPLLMTH